MTSKNKKTTSKVTNAKKSPARKPITAKPVTVNKTKKTVVKATVTPTATAHDAIWSKKAGAFALTIGIIEILTIIFQIINVVLQSKGKLTDELYRLGQSFVGVTSVIELAFIIVILCQWKAIKNATKLNHLWITVGYPVILGAALIFSLVMTFLPSNILISNTVAYVLIGISEFLNFLLASLSICIFCRIKKTVHE